MLRAVTLVHKGAMEIAIHSIRTFAYYFSDTHHLVIHLDPSIGEQEQKILLDAAEGIAATIITAKERNEKLDGILSDYPKTRAFLNSTSFYTKLEIPIYEEFPYLFFDSDVVWLRNATGIIPQNASNAFSTESWTFYPGIKKPRLWIKKRTPRRVNSGFQYIGQKFPLEKMEHFLSQNMFDRHRRYAGDQEIFAYLFDDMEYFHHHDFKRSRVGSHYDLKNEPSAAFHFPGSMWKYHIEQIRKMPFSSGKSSLRVRLMPSVPLSTFELIRMRLQINLGDIRILSGPLNIMRKLMRAYR